MQRIPDTLHEPELMAGKKKLIVSEFVKTKADFVEWMSQREQFFSGGI
jgi:hypothetical protein